MNRIYTYLKNTWIISRRFWWLKQSRTATASYRCHYHSRFLFYCPWNMYRFNDLERDQWNSSQGRMFINGPPVHCDVIALGLCQGYGRRQLRVSLVLKERKLATDQGQRQLNILVSACRKMKETRASKKARGREDSWWTFLSRRTWQGGTVVMEEAKIMAWKGL